MEGLRWVAAAALIAGAAGCGVDHGGDEYDVQVTCQGIVRDQLKNPSTADFSDKSQTRMSAGGTVVAENPLGGKVTYTYRCTRSGDTVTLDALTPRG